MRDHREGVGSDRHSTGVSQCPVAAPSAGIASPRHSRHGRGCGRPRPRSARGRGAGAACARYAGAPAAWRPRPCALAQDAEGHVEESRSDRVGQIPERPLISFCARITRLVSTSVTTCCAMTVALLLGMNPHLAPERLKERTDRATDHGPRGGLRQVDSAPIKSSKPRWARQRSRLIGTAESGARALRTEVARKRRP